MLPADALFHPFDKVLLVTSTSLVDNRDARDTREVCEEPCSKSDEYLKGEPQLSVQPKGGRGGVVASSNTSSKEHCNSEESIKAMIPVKKL